MECVLHLKYASASMDMKGSIATLQSVIRPVFMELPMSQINVLVKKAGQESYVTFQIALKVVATDTVLMLRSVSVTLAIILLIT